jgi:hypothetical protein
MTGLLTCRVCGEQKGPEGFPSDKKRKTGLSTRCSVCTRAYWNAWVASNKDKHKGTVAKYRARTAERSRERNRDWNRANPEKARAASSAWKKNNPERNRENQRKLRAKDPERARERARNWYALNSEKALEWGAEWRKSHRTIYLRVLKEYRASNRESRAALERVRALRKRPPPWVSRADLIEIYREARSATCRTGVLHVVDHIYPLRGKFVSGLHCPSNLQVIAADVNSRKSNKLPGHLRHEMWPHHSREFFNEG